MLGGALPDTSWLLALKGLLAQGHSEPLWSVNVGCIYSHKYFPSGQNDFDLGFLFFFFFGITFGNLVTR